MKSENCWAPASWKSEPNRSTPTRLTVLVDHVDDAVFEDCWDRNMLTG
jgi:hypothetical protein